MKNIIAICLTTLILLSQANGNIVDQLTELNNLYKSGAINEDEFSGWSCWKKWAIKCFGRKLFG